MAGRRYLAGVSGLKVDPLPRYYFSEITPGRGLYGACRKQKSGHLND